MKRTCIFLILCVLSAGFLYAQAKKGGTMYVIIKNLELKSSTGYFSSVIGKLEYGDQVTILQIKGNHAEISPASDSSISGWTSVPNLTAKKIITGNNSSATVKEVALAGKGFNQEVEKSYNSDGKYNYKDVDTTETMKVSVADLQGFIMEGHLSQGPKESHLSQGAK